MNPAIIPIFTHPKKTGECRIWLSDNNKENLNYKQLNKKNMKEELNFKQKTFKGVDCDVLEVYDRIKENLLARNPEWNEGQVFEELVERYSRPIRTNEENAAKVEQLTAEAETLKARIAELEEQLASAEATANSNAETANAQQLEYEQRIQAMTDEAASKALKETERVVSFIPDCLKAVEAVAARESKRRGQPWTVSHVINFFIDSRFIKGNLNGDLSALSDSECKKLGIALNLKPSKINVDL